MSQQPSLLPASELFGATFDETETYRYRLWRRWSKGAPVLWIMLNPSTADAVTDDPTIRRCINYAIKWGYPAIEVVNLYAYRATDPKVLEAVADPIGPGNLNTIEDAVKRAGIVVLAWGSKAKPEAVNPVLAVLKRAKKHPRCLARNGDGQPAHPLYLRKYLRPIPWSPPPATAARK